MAVVLSNLATCHEVLGDHAKAEPLQQRALSIREKVLGPEHAEVGDTLVDLAEIQRATGAYADAEALYARALAILEKALSPEHPKVARALLGLAEVARAQHRPADAVPLAQRAVEVQEQSGVAANDLAQGRFVLAQALWESPEGNGRDRTRAVTLAEQARDALQELGKGGVELLAKTEAWLREHVAPP